MTQAGYKQFLLKRQAALYSTLYSDKLELPQCQDIIYQSI